MQDRRNPHDYALGEHESVSREDLLTVALIVLPFAFWLVLTAADYFL
jgi:hypothetical protein